MEIIMARKGIKFSKAHKAKLNAAAKARYAKRKQNYANIFKEADAKIGTTLRVRLPNDYNVTDTPLHIRTNGLIDRMTQAIDKIENQIKRLETL